MHFLLFVALLLAPIFSASCYLSPVTAVQAQSFLDRTKALAGGDPAVPPALAYLASIDHDIGQLFYDSMRYKYWFQCVWGGKEMGQNILTTNYACQKNGRGCTGYIINLHNLAKQKYGPCGTANGFSYDYFAAAPSLEYGFAEENNAYDNNAQHHQHRHHGGYHAYNPTYMGNTQGVYNGFHP